jgi:hypothetical protein
LSSATWCRSGSRLSLRCGSRLSLRCGHGSRSSLLLWCVCRSGSYLSILWGSGSWS